MSTAHQSAPLDLRPTFNTRLLKLELESSELAPSSTISLELHVTSLANAPQYTAVSYVWGLPSPTKQILLNGQPFTVRQNLWDLLSRLRDVKYDDYLWIDALSIDQTNDNEKNHQVAMMGSIYKQAELTIAWFGVATKDAAKDIKRLKRIYSEKTVPVAGLAPYAGGLNYLFYNPYWTRTWILQEYVLSTDVIVMCGKCTITTAALEWIAHKWVESSSDDLPLFRGDAWKIITQTNASKRSDGSVSRKRLSRLTSLLSMTEQTVCVDPRDRIYALLSLLSKRERDIWAITPDYAKSAQTLFEDLCNVLRGRTLDIVKHRSDVWFVEQRLRDILLL